jgi:GntR family transcriptional regulator
MTVERGIRPGAKFAKVCESIIGRIESGALREGDRLPSEERLAAGFGISVGTVQKALQRLAQSGLIDRQHGRGTFVADGRAAVSDVTYLRFADEDGKELPAFIHVRSIRRVKRKGPWAEFLGTQGEHIRIERRVDIGGKLDLHSEFWLRESEYSRLNGSDRRALEKNLRMLLSQKLSLPTLRVDQSIRFERLPKAVAQELGLGADQPGFVMEMRGFTLRDVPLFYQRVHAAPFSLNLMIVR